MAHDADTDRIGHDSVDPGKQAAQDDADLSATPDDTDIADDTDFHDVGSGDYNDDDRQRLRLGLEYPGLLLHAPKRRAELMSEERDDQERPCLHCAIVEVIDEFFDEYPTATGGSDTVDTAEADEVIVAVAKTVAELTSRRDGPIRQRTADARNYEIRC